MSFLLDTNVLSELRRGARCHAKVREWEEANRSQRYFVSVITLGEIRRGIEGARHRGQDEKADTLEEWVRGLMTDYGERVLPVTPEVADRWGRIGAVETLPFSDSLIAATALNHDLTVAARNESDFTRCGVAVVNPFHDVP